MSPQLTIPVSHTQLCSLTPFSLNDAKFFSPIGAILIIKVHQFGPSDTQLIGRCKGYSICSYT